ncbi:MAG: aminoglycoside 6-adenylyltransferase [Pleurocapsa minor GSE-CHR-MK-17-07R]|jgi:hypothetical protein|nr:aminoglycoside 6-adenylyltransferase [Pleurocapsa minor GSE-CHR-MK 17-07R]
MSAHDFYTRLQTELVAWAEQLVEIRAILVVGSQARQINPADEYSSLDVSLYIVGGFEQKSETYLEWMRDFAAVWMILEEHHDETKSLLILYQGGIKVDFSVTQISALQALIDEKTFRTISSAATKSCWTKIESPRSFPPLHRSIPGVHACSSNKSNLGPV